jgi:hypothetical protein
MYQDLSENQAPYQPPPAYQLRPASKFGIAINLQALKKIPTLLSFPIIVNYFSYKANLSTKVFDNIGLLYI